LVVNNAAVEASSIVLIGKFNPAIFQPAWFGAEGLLRPAEAENAKIEIVRPEITKFTTDWLNLEVVDERFFVFTLNTSMVEALKDLVIGTFRLLRHTPIQQLDVISEAHIRVDDEDRWHDLGHKLAPKALWQDLLSKPGLNQLIMQGERTDGFAGAQFVRVEPSRRREFHPAVFCQVTDRYMIDTKLGCEKIMSILEEKWQSALTNADRIISEIMKR
jgi:hypothetical protein